MFQQEEDQVFPFLELLLFSTILDPPNLRRLLLRFLLDLPNLRLPFSLDQRQVLVARGCMSGQPLSTISKGSGKVFIWVVHQLQRVWIFWWIPFQWADQRHAFCSFSWRRLPLLLKMMMKNQNRRRLQDS